MILQELLVHDFSDDDDLMLAELVPGLNVVRVPDSRDMAVLHRFIPALLYGPTREDPAVFGSLLGLCGSEEIECLRLDDPQVPGLHVLDANGARALTNPLLEQLVNVPREVYRSVFSDALPVATRLDNWQSFDATGKLVEDTLGQPARPVLTATVADVDRDDGREIRDLIQRRGATLAELTNRNQQQDEYLAARKAADVAAEEVAELQSEIARRRESVGHLKLAVEFKPRLEQVQRLESQIKDLRLLKVDARDAKRLQHLEREIAKLRRRLGVLRQTALISDDAPSNDVKPELQRLLAQQDEVAVRQRRIRELRQRIARLEEAGGNSQRVRDELLPQIRSIRTTAIQLRTARHDFRQAVRRAANSLPPERSLPEPAPRPDRADPTPLVIEANESGTADADELQHRIRQLKAETRSLLQRRFVPPPIALALGVAFLVGSVLVLSAIFWDLGGVDIWVGAIGVTAVLASALLKISFQAPSAEQIKEHRHRINLLTVEMHRRESVRAAQAAKPAPKPPRESPPRPRSPGIVAEADRERSRQELESAFESWRNLLRRLELPADLTPAGAVSKLRARYPHATVQSATDVNGSHDELTRHESWLDSWGRQVVAALPHDVIAEPPGSPEKLISALEDAVRGSRTADDTSLDDQQSSRRLQLSELQQTIKQSKRSHGKILRRTGARDLNELRSLVKQKRQLPQLESERDRLQDEMLAKLAGAPSAATVQDLLRCRDLVYLKRQLNKEQRAIRTLQDRLKAPENSVADAAVKPERYVQDRRAAQLRLELNMLTEQLREASQRERTSHIARALATAAPNRRTVPDLPPDSPELLGDASRLLTAACQRECSIRYDARRREFIRIDEQGRSTSLREASKNDTCLALLCVQIALARQLSQQDASLPIVLTDVSLGYPAEHAIRVARLLVEASQMGTQLFLFTSHEAVSDLFAGLGIPTLCVEMKLADLPAPFTTDIADGEPEPLGNAWQRNADTDEWIPVEYQVVAEKRADHALSNVADHATFGN